MVTLFQYTQQLPLTNFIRAATVLCEIPLAISIEVVWSVKTVFKTFTV